MVRIVMNCLGKQNRRYLSRLSSNQIKSYRLSTIATPIATTEPSTIRITFLRHGQSTWNQQNIFIGKIFFPIREGRTEEHTDRMTDTVDTTMNTIHWHKQKHSSESTFNHRVVVIAYCVSHSLNNSDFE